MKKLLFVNACVRGVESRTLELARYYIEKFTDVKKAAGEDYTAEEVELDREFAEGRLLPLTGVSLAERSERMSAKDWDSPMFAYARDFNSADHIVIGAPFWDCNFPSLLRIYLERISVPGLTYEYDEKGVPQGRGRILGGAFIMTAGGPTAGMNYGYDYVNGLFRNLFRLPELTLYKGDMLDVIGVDANAVLRKTKEQILIDLGKE